MSQFISNLKKIAPHLFTNGKLNKSLLLAELDIEEYGLTWHGKKQAQTKAAIPCSKKIINSSPEVLSDDIFIRGDNLDALKLLQSTHKEKVDLIYIDPPYNTGKKFTYKDNFRVANSRKKSGHPATGIHDQWLSMMYPRLILAHQLLAEQGIIFISISDDEVHNLRIILDEVFHPRSFVAHFCWLKKKKGSHLSSTVRSMTEHILCYAKNKTKINLYGEPAYSDKWQPLLKKKNRKKQLCFPAKTVETKLKDGTYPLSSLRKNPLISFSNAIKVKNGVVQTQFTLEGPFVWVQTKLDQELQLGTRVALSSKLGINVFRHDQHKKFKRPTTMLDPKSNVGSYEDAFAELRDHLGEEYKFTYAKPTSLLRYLIKAATHFNQSAVIVDFFAGSASTGEATWQLNQIDGGNRKFILVQQEEPIDDPNFKTIADIGEARLRAVGKKMNRQFQVWSIR